MTSLTFVVEAVDPVDGRALVVPTEQEEVLGVLEEVSTSVFNLYFSLN